MTVIELPDEQAAALKATAAAEGLSRETWLERLACAPHGGTAANNRR